jgi:uncharacterized repeat protein (TIGR03803 family)
MKHTKFPPISRCHVTVASTHRTRCHSTLHHYLLRACCAVFVLCLASIAPSSAQTLSTLATFNVADGAEPNASLVQGTDGNFYGTTAIGGNDSCNPPNGCGTVFRITPGGTLTVLHRFCLQSGCPDGEILAGGLVLATDGNFYGATRAGGAHGGGTIFKITPQGKLTTLYSFCALPGCADGGGSSTTLIQASNGNFYGTAGDFGAFEGGTIFKITAQGKLTTLYNFCAISSCVDGTDPVGALFRGTDGELYGTTYAGGAFGYGTVFKLSSAGQLTTLHSFDFTDGANPTAALIQASNGKFYGSTEFGGTAINNCSNGCGTLFSITSAGAFALIDRLGWSNGAEPYSALIQATDGNLYGTTAAGQGMGTAFDITPGGRITNLVVFCCSDRTGNFPFGGLVQSTNGTFYGTTAGDGLTSNGTVYSLDAGLGPFITFVLSTGKVGSTAQILGQGLTSATSVTFNGVPASFAAVSDTNMTAVVPGGATSGKVVVTAPSGTLTSNVNFRITK